jgi:hypothetical protein
MLPADELIRTNHCGGGTAATPPKMLLTMAPATTATNPTPRPSALSTLMIVLPEIIRPIRFFTRGRPEIFRSLAIVTKRSAHIGETLHKSSAIIVHHDISQEVYKKTSPRDFGR